MISDDAKLGFQAIAKRWMEVTAHTLKPRSAQRRQEAIRHIAPFFASLTIRNITRQHCERWLTERGVKRAAMTMNRERELMRAVFNFAMKRGLILRNPAEDIERRRVVQAQTQIPTLNQFRNLVAAIRQSDGREDSQRKARPGADLVELLAYSGCRLGEATALTWADVDFESNTLKVTGGERRDEEPRAVHRPHDSLPGRATEALAGRTRTTAGRLHRFDQGCEEVPANGLPTPRVSSFFPP